MILVDDRVGSVDLAGHLRHWGVRCEVTRLEFGDACFMGNGPRGLMPVGIEIKTVRDALSCMVDGRFSGHQLPGLVRTYEKVWLVLEGYIYPRHSDGILQIGKPGKREPVDVGARRFMYRDLDNWLTSMEVCAGVKVRRTMDRAETARALVDLAGWFSKPWDQHHAHLAFDDSGPDVALLVKPGLVRRVAAQLKGIGWGKSQAVAQRFRTVEEMVAATPAIWQSIPGIGNKLAWECYNALRSVGYR